jgi:prepilin-type N-terminal cleavage/methylation domain-containing protein
MRLAPPGANSRRAAFTLLEVLTVVALVAILAGLTLGVGSRAVDASRAKRARAELATIAAALDAYKRVHGDYPRTDDPAELLRALLGQRGPASPAPLAARASLDLNRLTVINNRLVDPWEEPYRYAYKEPPVGWLNPGFVLYSPGPDRRAFSRLTSGGFPDRSAAENLDNVYAGQN